jgi:hypothetical protein
MRYLITFVCIILLSACGTMANSQYSTTVNSWNGASAASLMKAWGEPDQVIPGEHGTKFLVYKTTGYSAMGGQPSPSIGVNMSAKGRPVIVTIPNTNNAINRGALSLNCITIFEVNAKNIVIHTEYKGSGCRSSRLRTECPINKQGVHHAV